MEATSGAAAGKVRIWYQNRYAATDAALAGSLMSAMETKIWPSLTDAHADGAAPRRRLDRVLFRGLGRRRHRPGGRPNKATTYASGLSQEGTSAKMIFPRTGSGSTARPSSPTSSCT